jgi:predicted pyridoxine 5'-phosphate oxidase superfamily flavin-nucleotide-binding protein
VTWHQGELQVQRRTGVTDHEKLRRGVRDSLPPHFCEFLSLQSFAVATARDADGRLWCFPVLGEPGFINAREPELIDASRDDFLACAPPGVLAAGGPVGLLVIDPFTRRRIRINGELSLQDSVIAIKVRETFGNCQQYIQKRAPFMRMARPAPVQTPATTDLGRHAWIGRADTMFLGTSHDQHGLDASHRGGRPGFIAMAGPNRLRFADYPGNNMFQSLGNIVADGAAAMLLPNFDTGTFLLLSGRAELRWHVDDSPTERCVEFEASAAIEQQPGTKWMWPVIEYSPVNP